MILHWGIFIEFILMNPFFIKKPESYLRSDLFLHKVLTSKIKCLPNVLPFAKNYSCPGTQYKDTHSHTHRLKGLKNLIYGIRTHGVWWLKKIPQHTALRFGWATDGPLRDPQNSALWVLETTNADNMFWGFPRSPGPFQNSCGWTGYKESVLNLVMPGHLCFNVVMWKRRTNSKDLSCWKALQQWPCRVTRSQRWRKKEQKRILKRIHTLKSGFRKQTQVDEKHYHEALTFG